MTKRLLMVGLSGSGKTTYVIALACALREPAESSPLETSRLSPSSTYLNRLMKSYGQCDTVSKTAVGNREEVQFFVRDRETGAEFQLGCPDLSGETYDDHWATRQWSKERDAEVTESSGALLFLTAAAGHTPSLLDEEHQVAGGASDASAKQVESASWSPSTACKQVKLVEILQFVRARHHRPIRLSVIVSAWDRVNEQYADPEDWLARETPLLWQSLKANAAAMPYCAFGVSAQGGKYPDDRDRLREIRPSHRPIVTSKGDGGGRNQDICRPVSWVLSEAE